MKREDLIATCGTYCGACEMYRAVHDNNEAKQQAIIQKFNARGGNLTIADLACDGCLAGGRLSPWCRECNIKSCSKLKPGETICSPSCADFPCQLLNDFVKQMPHHEEVIDNLRRLEKVGLKKHAEEEEKRWLCPQCGTPMTWYYKTCYKCGAERSKELYTVPDGMF
jgi:hypothetical protein